MPTRPFTFADTFEVVADAVPNQMAIVTEDRRLTYAEVDERATRLAHALQARGVRPGDHIGLYLYNGTEYVEAMLAAWKIRAVPVNVNYRYVEEELVYLFDDADLVAVIHHQEFAPRLAAVADQVPGVRAFLSVADDSGADPGSLATDDYEDALAAASPERDFAERSGDDLYILYTGGTTGMPKGVMWRQEDIFFAAMDLSAMGLAEPPSAPEDLARRVADTAGTLTMATAAPLMHGAAQWAAFICFHQGNTLVLTASRGFDPPAIWRMVEQERVTTMTVVGDAMARPLAEELLAHPDAYDLSSFFALGSGGAILSQGVKDQFTQARPDLVITDAFGASETGAQGGGVGASEEGHPRFAVNAETNVLDEDHRPIEAGSGKQGMLARTGRIPLGYYKDEEKTARTFVHDPDGQRWVIPGDFATVEADGTITLFGRGSVSINSGGEKIFPEEVEAALKSHPAVFDAVVVGVPDDRFGQRVAAVVAPRQGETPTLDELVEHARTKIAGYKVPRELHLVDEVTRSPSGKADYRWAKAVATRGPSSG
jgi:acyl-CoA synthetase (AMP-forming)/AMP-acid ligase II